MPDFLVSYTDEPTLNAVAQNVPGLWANGKLATAGFGTEGGGFAISDPFQWYVPTGQTTNDAMGNTVPATAAKSGWFRILRWNDALGTMPLPPGVTPTVDPQTGTTTINAGPVTMVSPLPADAPVSF